MKFIVFVNEEQSKQLQQLAFNKGYQWSSGRHVVFITMGNLIFNTDTKVITYDSIYNRNDGIKPDYPVKSVEEAHQIINGEKMNIPRSKMSDKEAIEKSLKKWIDIFNNDDVDKGTENCALCQKYIAGGCQVDGKRCPIYQETGECGCQDTPYKRFYKAIGSRKINSVENLDKRLEGYNAAHEMIELLQKIQKEQIETVDWDYVKTHYGVYCTDNNGEYLVTISGNTGKIVLWVYGNDIEEAFGWENAQFTKTKLTLKRLLE